MAGNVQAQTVQIPPRIPLPSGPHNRGQDTTKDAKLVNCYIERLPDGTVTVKKRPGMLLNASYGPGTASTGNGCFTDKQYNTYAVFGTNLYGLGGVLQAGLVNQYFTFAEIIANTLTVFLNSGAVVGSLISTAWTHNAALGTWNAVVAYPAQATIGSAYLDNYMYVGSNATPVDLEIPTIFASSINDPTSWPGGNSIIPQIESDLMVFLAKQQSFVIAFKQFSIELFYDNAGVPVPIAPYSAAKKNIGLASPYSVQNIDGTLVFMSTSLAGEYEVHMLDNINLTKISDKYVEKLLDGALASTDPTVRNIMSWWHKDEGHTFYVITSTVKNVTLAYDFDEKSWSQWTDVNGNYMPICGSTFLQSARQTLLQHATNGKMYQFDTDYTNDDGAAIVADIVFDNFDGGTRRKKTVNQLELLYDVTPGAQIWIRNNDKDFKSTAWTPWRQYDMSQDSLILTDEGDFRRRAYQFRMPSDAGFRILGLEIQVDIGTS